MIYAWLMIGIIGFIFLMFLISMMKISCRITIILSTDEQRLAIIISTFFERIHVESEFSLNDLMKTRKGNDKGLSLLKNNKLKLIWSFGIDKVLPMLHKIHISTFHWKTNVGLGDAMDTSVAAGILWMIKGNVLSLLKTIFSSEWQPEILVNPNYQQFMFESTIHCKVEMRIVSMLWNFYTLGKEWKKYIQNIEP